MYLQLIIFLGLIFLYLYIYTIKDIYILQMNVGGIYVILEENIVHITGKFAFQYGPRTGNSAC